MTTSINNIKDGFLATFDEESHSDMLSYLREVEKDTRWEPIEAKNTFFVPLSEVPESELAAGAGEGYQDALSSPLPICAVLPDGRKYLLRPYLLKNIKQHHRDNAVVLSDMLNRGDIRAFCDHISLGRPFLKKQILMMTRGEKVSGWFSEFNGNWSQLAQVSFFEEKMKESFPALRFLRAEVSHYYTAVNYQLDETMSSRELHAHIGLKPGVMDAYLDAWVSAGLPAELLRDAVPVCQFVTGESGLTSIEVRPTIRLSDGTVIPLGGILSVNHRGADESVWGKFETFPGKVAILYQKGLAGLESLCERKIFNPYCATTHVLNLFRASIPAEALRSCAANAEIFWPRDIEDITCCAIDIFNIVNEMVTEANKKLSPVRRLRNMEMVGRLCHSSWGDFDVGHVNKFFSKSDLKFSTPDDDFGID